MVGIPFRCSLNDTKDQYTDCRNGQRQTQSERASSESLFNCLLPSGSLWWCPADFCGSSSSYSRAVQPAHAPRRRPVVKRLNLGLRYLILEFVPRKLNQTRLICLWTACNAVLTGCRFAHCLGLCTTVQGVYMVCTGCVQGVYGVCIKQSTLRLTQ